MTSWGHGAVKPWGHRRQACRHSRVSYPQAPCGLGTAWPGGTGDRPSPCLQRRVAATGPEPTSFISRYLHSTGAVCGATSRNCAVRLVGMGAPRASRSAESGWDPAERVRTVRTLCRPHHARPVLPLPCRAFESAIRLTWRARGVGFTAVVRQREHRTIRRSCRRSTRPSLVTIRLTSVTKRSQLVEHPMTSTGLRDRAIGPKVPY